MKALDAVVLVVFLLATFLVIGSVTYELGQKSVPVCPEPVPIVCMVKTTHPATDGGTMHTVHCP